MQNLTDLFYALADYLVFDLINLTGEAWYMESLRFFIANFSKITLLLVVAIYLMTLVTSYLSYDRIGAILEKYNKLGAGNVIASLLGVVSPFCSCSSVPLFVGMMQGRVPLGISLSFLITSPLVNEVAVAVFWVSYGWKVTLIYIASGVILGITGGLLLEWFGFERYVADWIQELEHKEDNFEEQDNKPFMKRLPAVHGKAYTTILNLIPYVFLGMLAGAFIHGYVPPSFFDTYLPDSSLLAVPISVVMAIPLYLDAVSILPIIESLVGKGIPLGTAIAFMMGAIGLSLPEALLLKKVMKNRLLIGFFVTIGIGMILSGYLFNMVF